MKTNTPRRSHLHRAVSKKQLPVRTACATRLLALLVSLFLTLPAAVQAQFNYTTINGTITITGYSGPGGAVSIPATINGLPVTRIGDDAFNGKTSLTSVTIPNSVTSIGYYAFSFCTNLTSVTIPNSVTNIRGSAFYSCFSLTSVTMPNSVTNIGGAAFSSCTSLSTISVDVPNSLYSSVGGVLFNKSQTLLIQFPGGKAGNYTIPNAVTSIGDGAFIYCTSLTNIAIPNSVTSIASYAFSSCTSLSAITVDALNSFYSSVDGVLFNKTQTLLIQCPGGKAGSYTIPSSVTSVGGDSFSGSTGLTSVTIPNSVTSIGDLAFSSCTSLTSVMIGNGVTSLGIYAFFSCSSLSAITVDALNSFYSSVDGVLFNKSQTLLIQFPGGKAGSYMIPNTVTSIGYYAFSGSTGLTSIRIPNSVTSIGEHAFEFCTSLTCVTIGNGVTSIEFGAFFSCTNLTGVYFQGNAPSVRPVVFSGANNATVYYLPGTTGWGTTFAGRPAVLWNPLMQTGDASFGVRTNRFGFTITGANNLVIVVEASTNLANPA